MTLDDIDSAQRLEKRPLPAFKDLESPPKAVKGTWSRVVLDSQAAG